MIVEKANAGQMDHVKHALDLFVDFAAIFVRLLVRCRVSVHVPCAACAEVAYRALSGFLIRLE